MENQDKLSALEKLEQEFEKEKSGGKAQKKVGAKGKKNRFQDVLQSIRMKRTNYKHLLPVLVGVFVIAAAVAIAVNAARKSGDDQISKIPDFLTEEEKADWKNKEVDKDQIFIYVNTNFTLQAGETEVPLRLVNPPYCAYPLKVVVLDTGRPDQPLYESEMTEPGESIENVDFENLPQDAGTYDLKIKYTYYDEKGESVVGEHEVGAKLELKE